MSPTPSTSAAVNGTGNKKVKFSSVPPSELGLPRTQFYFRPSCVAYFLFVLELMVNALIVVVFLAPGWGWTRELGGGIDRGSRGMGSHQQQMTSQYGLWFVCSQRDVEASSWTGHCMLTTDLKQLPGWWYGCQALASVALAAGVTTAVIAGCYVCAQKLMKRISFMVGVGILSTLSGCLLAALAGLFAWGFLQGPDCCTGDQFRLHYCFGLGVGASALQLLCGALALIECATRLR